MSRLPSPGGDTGNWGTILNDYLSQVHNADGTLKNGVVGAANLASGAISSAALQNNAVTSSNIADGAITTSKLSASAVPTSNGIRSLLIFYSAPNIMNAQYNDDYATGVMARYDDVVLGAGLEIPTDTYYTNTKSSIAKLAVLSPNTVVWGYINCGVSIGNASLSTLQTQIDQWVAIGVKGIFCDLMGYDYHTSRDRQNSVLSYIHSKGIGAIINAWNPDDVFSSTVDATYNPSGTATVAGSSDVLLLESWVCNSDAYASPYYATFSDIKTRGDKAVSYRTSLGIRIFAVNIILNSGKTFSQIKAYRDYAEAFARVWRLDATGTCASNYSSTGSDLGVVTPQFSSFLAIPQRNSGVYILNGGWTQVQATDLGIIINYNSGTSTYTWTQQ